MKVKVLQKKGLFQAVRGLLVKQRHPVRVAILSVVSIMLILTIILISLFLGMFLHKIGVAEVLNKMKQAKSEVIVNYFKGCIAVPKRMAINIKHMDYQKLVHMREIALERGHITQDCKIYVPALIQYEGNISKAKIRLKGDAVDHIQRDKWSFRIAVKGDETILGMKRFSIQHPKTRRNVYEWIFHKVIQREGILVPRYEFIEVVLNGKNKGIYAMEEHFEKRLVENNNRREGPIIKFNEDIQWADENALQVKGCVEVGSVDFQTGLQEQTVADIDAFSMNNILRTPRLYRQFVLGKDLLESFRRGMLSAHKVFDVEKMARYFAVSELMSALHATSSWGNLRFYYNPVTSLLEPIAFDAYMGEECIGFDMLFPAKHTKDKPSDFYDRIFSDIVFLEEYVKTLERISKKTYLDSLFDSIGTDLKKSLNVIYKEFPYYRFSKDIFYMNQKKIQVLLNPSKGLHAYFYKVGKANLELEIGNLVTMPIEILGVRYKEQKILNSVDEEIILFPKNRSDPVDYKHIRFLFPKGFIWSDSIVTDLEVKYRILGTDSVKYANIFPYSVLSDNFIENDFIRQHPNVDDFKFLKVNESSKKIFIKRGNWNLNHSLIIPKNYEVVCQEGTRLNITNFAVILSYSPLKFFGSKERPIVIYSTDSTGQGIVVLNAGEGTALRNVIFSGLSNPSHGGWELTGAVTFYESDVKIDSCRFSDSTSEDGLNIIRSNFSIKKSFFDKTFSDALDVDFGKGEIISTSFIDCGNDAIDISGSFVEIRDVFVNGAGDKGLSVGEGSKVTAKTVEIINTVTAVASKDMSDLNVNNIKISDCKIGFSVYQKKTEFGPAFLAVTGLTACKIDTLYLVEKDSKLKVDGKMISSDQDEVKGKLNKRGKIGL